MPKSKKAARGRRPTFLELEESVAAWIQDQRMNGFIVTRTQVRTKALNMKQPEFLEFKPKDFVASVGWCNNLI